MRCGVVVWRWFGMDGWWVDMDGVVVNVLKMDIIIILLMLFTSHALRMRTTAKY